jgi:hypothetical protein
MFKGQLRERQEVVKGENVNKNKGKRKRAHENKGDGATKGLKK